MGVKIVPDLTIIEEGVGPAIDVWPDTAAGTPVTPPVYPPASWSQATWFVDPQNVTGNASDSNSGLTVADPVLSYTGGIVQKWGTTSPTLRQNTTITWLSSQPAGAGDPVVLTPLMVGAILILTAPLGPAQQIHAGVLGAVVPKNRNTPQLLTADLGFAAPVINSLVLNTTHNSFAWVYKNVAGTVFAMTQPLVPMPAPVDSGGFSGAQPIAEVDTWAPGDAFAVYQPIGVNIVELAPVIAEFHANFPGFLAAQVQVQHITFLSANGPGNSDAYVGDDVTVIECASEVVFTNVAVSDDESIFYLNTYLAQGAFAAAGANPYTYFMGGALIATTFSGDALINWNLDFDVILDGVAATIQLHKLVFMPAQTGVGLVYVAGTCRFAGPWLFGIAFSAGPSIAWGPGTIDTVGAARLDYDPTEGAVATFKVATLLLNGQASASAYDAASHTWAGPIAITAANLDAAFPAGFGGTAVNVGGSSYTNQGTP